VEAFDRSVRAGVVLGVVLALAAAALLRSAPAPALDGSDLPDTVVAALDSDAALVDVTVVLQDDHFVAWTTDLGLQACLDVAISTAPPPRVIDEAPPGDIVLGSVCGPVGTLPTDSITLTRTVADAAGRYGVVVLVFPDEYRAAEWDIDVTPSATRLLLAPNAAALEYDGEDWERASAGVAIEVDCGCGSFHSEVGFGGP
jgi:hypothetical protein